MYVSCVSVRELDGGCCLYIDWLCLRRRWCSVIHLHDGARCRVLRGATRDHTHDQSKHSEHTTRSNNDQEHNDGRHRLLGWLRRRSNEIRRKRFEMMRRRRRCASVAIARGCGYGRRTLRPRQNVALVITGARFALAVTRRTSNANAIAIMTTSIREARGAALHRNMLAICLSHETHSSRLAFLPRKIHVKQVSNNH